MKALLLKFLLLVALFCAVAPIVSHAETATSSEATPFDKKRLLVQPRNADGTIAVTPFFESPVLWARDEQQNFYGAMSRAMKGIQGENALAAGWTLMLLSFAYGVLHAAGPGHGKAVISAWLLATENQLRRGIAVAFMSAVVQALTAIVVVSSLLALVGSVGSAARDAAAFLESASFALIALMGAYLLWTAFRGHAHEHEAAPARASANPGAVHFEIVNPLPAAHGHDHVHDANCDCGYAHVPTAKDVAGPWSWRKAFSLAFAVGIRPCTGALLVLVFANALGLYWAGIASTFVMAAGTFITVSCVAALAVYSKQLAEKLAGRDGKWLGRLGTTLRFGGGLAILLFGCILFTASLYGPTGSM
jgi:ABC-type nickel/cobalt efflux system permease component RcnA